MERDILFARQVKAECKENGVVCLVNDGSRTKGDMFNNPGLNLCLMNGYYDEQFPEQKETRGPSYDEYDNMSKIANSTNTKKVFINLGVEDLDKEYQRILDLGIGINMTPIRYLNVFSPYWYFTFMDPDGNPIEITGGHKE